VPVAETAWWRLGALTARSAALFVHWTVKVAGEQQDLLPEVLQPRGQGPAGVAALVPVAEPTVDRPEGGGLVVPFQEPAEHFLVKGGVAARPGVLDGLVRLAQDRDDLSCPGLEAARAEAQDRAAAADDSSAATFRRLVSVALAAWRIRLL